MPYIALSMTVQNCLVDCRHLTTKAALLNSTCQTVCELDVRKRFSLATLAASKTLSKGARGYAMHVGIWDPRGATLCTLVKISGLSKVC